MPSFSRAAASLILIACPVSCGGVATETADRAPPASAGGPVDASGDLSVNVPEAGATDALVRDVDSAIGAEGDVAAPVEDGSIDVPVDAATDAPRRPCSYEALPPVVVPSEIAGQPRTWNGDGYSIVRAVIQTGGYFGSSMFALRWASLDASGAFLGEKVAFDFRARDPDTGLLVDLGHAATRAIAVAGDGYGIVWEETDRHRLMFAFLDAAGHGLGDPVALVEGAGLFGPLALTWTGTELALLFGAARGLTFAKVDRSGVATAPVLSIAPTALIGDLLMFRRNDGYLVFYENFHQALDEMRIARLDSAGTLVGATVGLTDPESYMRRPLVVAVGGGYAAVWSDQPNRGAATERTVMTRFDGEGTIVEQRQITAKPSALAWSGEDFGVIVDTGDAIRFGVLDDQGVLRPETIDIALTVTTDTGKIPPIISSFDWHAGRFGLFYLSFEGGSSTTRFVRIVCRR